MLSGHWRGTRGLAMARVPQKQGRCNACGFRIRGKGHELGAHHNGGRIGKKIMAKGRRGHVV